MKHLLLLLGIALCLSVSCDHKTSDHLLDEGVSLELAQFRAAHYSDPHYDLSFDLPEDPTLPVEATISLAFSTPRPVPVILDWTGDAPKELTINGQPAPFNLINQHIVIPKRFVLPGTNRISAQFTAGDTSLNRRDEFLYTLLVPDRARTLFPCFDQPDLKGRFTLTLTVPDNWQAIGNGSVETSSGSSPESPANPATPPANPATRTIRFTETDPIPTYLFSFVAGRFERITRSLDGRSVSLFHRETDPAKIAQCDTILDEVFHSLRWMEQYTGVPYPFEKYDLVILPGFQYGGMEHTGATLYNDSRMFVEPNATTTELLGRSSLIAHETAHMWFGDYVTMRWFDDVWNKEVFANWFAARIVEPMYPAVNHRLNFILSYFPPAYSEDRTAGAMPIRQHLPNLRDAGLIYSNIVYNKSPIVMDMLVRRVGEEAFRDAVREYLHAFAYGNATWDDLVGILDRRSDDDLRAWSDTWVKQRGMPTITLRRDGGKEGTEEVEALQSDPWGRADVVWQQDVASLEFDGHLIPNSDGRAYGYFTMDGSTVDWALANLGLVEDEVVRLVLTMNLYEGLLNRAVDPARFLDCITSALRQERNIHIYNRMLSCAEQCVHLFLRDLAVDIPALNPTSVLAPAPAIDAANTSAAARTPSRTVTAALALERFEIALLSLADSAPTAFGVPALRAFCRVATTPQNIATLHNIWADPTQAARYSLSERDLTDISFELAIRLPEEAPRIIATQLGRISNPDRRAEYEFVSQAVAPTQSDRDAFFESLLLAENRAVEPWTIAALRLLNHPARQHEALKYIRPGLDALAEIQRTGDIFLPSNWCSALLAGHTSPEALAAVEKFLVDNPDYPELLASKILIHADHLYRAGTNPSAPAL